MPYGVRTKIAPRDKHDLVGKIMLHLSLQPPEQVYMLAHRYPFLNDAEVALEVISRE